MRRVANTQYLRVTRSAFSLHHGCIRVGLLRGNLKVSTRCSTAHFSILLHLLQTRTIRRVQVIDNITLAAAFVSAVHLQQMQHCIMSYLRQADHGLRRRSQKPKGVTLRPGGDL